MWLLAHAHTCVSSLAKGSPIARVYVPHIPLSSERLVPRACVHLGTRPYVCTSYARSFGAEGNLSRTPGLGPTGFATELGSTGGYGARRGTFADPESRGNP